MIFQRKGAKKQSRQEKKTFATSRLGDFALNPHERDF
jgi:hypothetical protein